MDRRTRRQALTMACALVWTAALAASFGRFRLAAKAPVLVSLATTPPAVRVTIDGIPYEAGAYVTTPLKLAVPAGAVKIKIWRDGYIANESQINARAGESRRLENIVLEKDLRAAFAKVEVTFPQNSAPLNVEIDDGLVRGETPLMTDEVKIGIEHVLTVYPRWPDRETRFRCRFTPEGANGAEHKIKLVQTKAGGVKAAGCERMRDKDGNGGVKKKAKS